MSQKSYNGTPTLYLISTPIGNMEDITIRALETLKKVEVIFSEDTRVTSQILKKYEIKKRLIANHQHNEIENGTKLLNFLDKGFDVGLVTDRGTPIISDPGYHLTQVAINNNYNVVAIPGASALLPALIVSGIMAQPFTFIGFLNSRESKRKKELEKLKMHSMTLIFYEAPHRITETLNDMLHVFGNRKCSIAREISKKYEEIYRGDIKTLIEETQDVKGELVIVVEGNQEINNFDNLSIIEHVNLYIREGNESKEAIKKVAHERNLTKNEVYSVYHNIKDGDSK